MKRRGREDALNNIMDVLGDDVMEDARTYQRHYGEDPTITKLYKADKVCTFVYMYMYIKQYMWYMYVYVLRTDYQPSDRFKTVRTALKPSDAGWGRGRVSASDTRIVSVYETACMAGPSEGPRPWS